MREYQYLEFRAIDHTLDRKAQQALRSITTRAEITPTSLVNEYNFGSFKGEPLDLMKNYFDVFFYFAAWGSREFMLRFPSGSLDLSQIQPFCCDYTLDVHTTPTHLILEFHAEEDDIREFEGNDDEVTLDALVGVREDLLNGDLRPLYIAWLSSLDWDEPDTDTMEPPVPSGLKNLTPTLESFASFMRVDPLLLEVAAEASCNETLLKTNPEDYSRWLANKSLVEKETWLVRLMKGEGPTLRNELLLQFRTEEAESRGEILVDEETGMRTVGDLLQSRATLAATKKIHLRPQARAGSRRR